MNLKRLFSCIVISGTILNVSQAVAQLKVGSNPSSIEPTSNLEVEAATAGRKVKVEKITGQLTIADGTEGDGRILTSDANGGASWKSSASGINFYATLTANKTFTASGSGGAIVNFDVANPNNGNGYNTTTDAFTAPVNGIYYFIGTAYIDNSPSGAIPAGTYNDYLSIKVNGTAIITQENYQYIAVQGGNAFSISLLKRLNAGDTVQLFGGSNKPTPRYVSYANSINAPQTTFQGFLIGN